MKFYAYCSPLITISSNSVWFCTKKTWKNWFFQILWSSKIMQFQAKWKWQILNFWQFEAFWTFSYETKNCRAPKITLVKGVSRSFQPIFSEKFLLAHLIETGPTCLWHLNHKMSRCMHHCMHLFMHACSCCKMWAFLHN